MPYISVNSGILVYSLNIPLNLFKHGLNEPARTGQFIKEKLKEVKFVLSLRDVGKNRKCLVYQSIKQ